MESCILEKQPPNTHTYMLIHLTQFYLLTDSAAVLQPVAHLPRQSPFPLLGQVAVGTLWKDFGLVSYDSVRMEEKYLYLPDWCFIHQFKTVAPLTLDSGRWRLLRVYDPSLTPRRDILLERVRLCACVGVTVYKTYNIIFFVWLWGRLPFFTVQPYASHTSVALTQHFFALWSSSKPIASHDAVYFSFNFYFFLFSIKLLLK